jgi:hypothetical protein
MKHHACALALVLAAAACNTSQEGAEGNILFTPDECGRVGGCNFEDSIGVGGTINVNIMGLDGFSTAGVTLEVDDPGVLTVIPVGDVGGRPTWELQGIAPGVATLYAYDADDARADFIEIGVQELSGLTLENFVGDAVGPADDAGYDEVWTVNADQAVSFFVTPTIGDGIPTMGRYTYVATVDSALVPYLMQMDRLEEGYLYFDAPAGAYEVSFDDGYGHYIDVLLIAE